MNKPSHDFANLLELFLDRSNFSPNFIKVARSLIENDAIHGDLEVLEKAGADSRNVVPLIALEIIFKQRWFRRGHWLHEMRRQRERYKNLATRLRKLAWEINNALAEDEPPHELKILLHPEEHNAHRPEPEKFESEEIKGLLDLAEGLEAKAYVWGLTAKLDAPSIKRMPIVILLRYLHRRPGGALPHLQRLSEIMATAYEICGVTALAPTAESLRKELHRHVLRKRGQLPPSKKP